MKRILVVDDEIELCNVFKEFLVLKGYEVDVAHNGKSAINKVKEMRPHIVLLDIIMPGMNGIDILKEIKRINPAIEVIMITAVGNEKIAEKTFELEARDFICKPVNLNYLENVLMVKIVDILG